MELPDLGLPDLNFDSPFRSRSNTWPLRPREFIKDESNTPPPPTPEEPGLCSPRLDGQSPVHSLGLVVIEPLTQAQKKSSSRRNAWGNMSYADLITKAIQTAPEQRLTLSQIYDWMVQNVPYFKDKGDSNSSAGWKNSIRHNLSLHSRFMRMQNEGTGKSSWWVINPDAKPGKSPRRRATSMDTKTLEKKRGRVKKRIENMRAMQASADGSPISMNDSESDLMCEGFFSPDYRARTSSSASSISRLSPIQPIIESEVVDSSGGSVSPCWTPGSMQMSGGYNNVGDGYDLAEMLQARLDMDNGQSCRQYQDMNAAPPPYPDGSCSPISQPHIVITNKGLATGGSVGHGNPQVGSTIMQALQLLQDNTNYQPNQGNQNQHPQEIYSNGTGMSYNTISSQHLPQHSRCIQQLQQQQQQQQQPLSNGMSQHPLLRQVLMHKQLQEQQQQQQQQQTSCLQQHLNSSEPPHRMMFQQSALLKQEQMGDHYLPADLDLNMVDLTDDFPDVEQTIKHELSYDSSLDFNFEGPVTTRENTYSLQL